ncbi:MAG: hypothetical protein K2X52_06550 [Mycobacteriaceae bacterium]|nr:hypothetical protein [Mycobacteriaceae bacterium]
MRVAGQEVTPEIAHTPLRALVPGLDDVGASAIPYARLPRRAATAFAAKFERWSDIADQTLASLWAGEGTMDALVAAAKEAVAGYRAAATGARMGPGASVDRLLGALDERDRVMVSARLWTAPPRSQAMVAQRLGVTKAWVHRHQSRALARFAELLAAPIHQEVSVHAAALGRRLGPYIPEEVVCAELSRLGIDPTSEAAHVLLHLAGAYARRGDWLENTATGGAQRVTAAVDAVFDRTPAPSTETLLHALIVEGMPLAIVGAYLRSREDWRCFGGNVWVRWGDSAASRAEAVLHVRGGPATLEDIFAAIGGGPLTVNAVREALYRERRFVRAGVQTWGLRAWGIDEYAGSISEEIATRIDAAGGTISVDQLIHDIRSCFTDVAERSIRTNLTSLAFITDGTTVRRRTDIDEWPPTPPLYAARGAFRNGHKEIRLAMAVNADVLRGSGQPIHPAVAAALGVTPGQRRLFASPHGPVAVIWRLSSTNGPNIGSVRAPAKALDADLTDTLVLIFSPDAESLAVERIGAEVSGVARLRRLLGHTVRVPAAALAASLRCPRADVAAVLRERGDGDLADLIGASTDTNEPGQ